METPSLSMEKHLYEEVQPPSQCTDHDMKALFSKCLSSSLSLSIYTRQVAMRASAAASSPNHDGMPIDGQLDWQYRLPTET